MSDSDSREVYCPNCRHYVVPLKATVNWYCPRCAWQFSDEEIERYRAPPPPPDEASATGRPRDAAPREPGRC